MHSQHNPLREQPYVQLHEALFEVIVHVLMVISLPQIQPRLRYHEAVSAIPCAVLKAGR